MSDLSRFVANKLSGEWSASNVSGVLTDVIIEYLVTGEKWESLDPLVRSRLLLAPLFMRKRDLADLRPALAKLAAAGAADKDEWVRAMAQSVGDYDGRLHNDRLLAGSKLVGKTVAGLQPLLDAADARLFRPLEEVYMNKELLQKLRGSSAAQGGVQQPAAAAATAAPKAHHHFRLRPASEAPSQRHPGGSAAAAGRPAAAAAPSAAAAPQAGLARGAAQPARPVGAGGLGSRALGAVSGVAAPSATGRLRQTGGGADIDSMFLPRKPSLQRPAGLGGRGRGAAAPPVRRAATLDVEAAKNLAQQMQAERAKAEQAAREAAEAEARAKAEARAAERAVREAEKEVEAKRRAAEKAAAREAARAEKEAARAAAKAAKGEDKEERDKAKAARAEAAAAAKAAVKAAKPQQRKRSASEGGEPPAKRSATNGSEGEPRAAALPTPEAAAEALGEAALAAAADAAGMRLGGRGGRPDVEAMQAYLAAAYGGGRQPGAGSAGDVEEEHI